MSTIPAIRAVEFRLRAYRNDAPTDLTGFLTRARVSLGDVSTVGTGAAGGDGLSITADITLLNDRPGHDPLQPGADSSFNRPNPLLSPNRRIMLDVRATPEGQAFGRWVTVFDGLLNATRLQNNGSRVQVRAQDWAKVLQRTMMPGTVTYGAAGGQRLDLVIQQLITDNVPNAPVIHVIGTPSFFVEPYQPAFGSVWDAIQQLVTQAGWYFGMRRGIGGAFALTLMDPPRDKTTPDWVFTGEDVITVDVDRDDVDVRNAFLVRYVDGATREPTQYPLSGPHVNPQSVDALGGVQQLMIIELGDTSQIDTAAEAQALLERADHDLSSMLDATQVELPIMPELNLFDTVSVNVPSIGSQQLFAVNSLEHTIDIPARGGAARYRTTISGSSKVAGKYRNWLDLEVRPGSPNDKPGPHQTRLLPPRIEIEQGQPGFTVYVDAGAASRGVGAIGVELHVSTTSGFTPGPGTLWAKGPEEQWTFTDVPRATHFVRARAYDERDRPGPLSPQHAILPGWIDGVPQIAFVTNGQSSLQALLSGVTPVGGFAEFNATSNIRSFPEQTVPAGFQLAGVAVLQSFSSYHWTGPPGPDGDPPDPPVFVNDVASLTDQHVDVEVRESGVWRTWNQFMTVQSFDAVRIRYSGGLHFVKSYPSGGELVIQLTGSAQLWFRPANVPG